MNIRILPCNKSILAIGQEGSIADLKNKVKYCFECYDFVICKLSQQNFKDIIQEQNKLIALNLLNHITI